MTTLELPFLIFIFPALLGTLLALAWEALEHRP